MATTLPPLLCYTHDYYCLLYSYSSPLIHVGAIPILTQALVSSLPIYLAPLPLPPNSYDVDQAHLYTSQTLSPVADSRPATHPIKLNGVPYFWFMGSTHKPGAPAF